MTNPTRSILRAIRQRDLVTLRRLLRPWAWVAIRAFDLSDLRWLWDSGVETLERGDSPSWRGTVTRHRNSFALAEGTRRYRGSCLLLSLPRRKPLKRPLPDFDEVEERWWQAVSTTRRTAGR